MTVNDPTSETHIHSKQRLSSRLSPLCPYSSNDSMSTDSMTFYEALAGEH